MNRESKQSKKFCELALKALPPGTARKDVRAIYKTIKHEKNETYKYLGAAMAALEKKVKLDMSIQSYNNIINDTTKFTIREVQNAKSHLARLIFSNETTSLITEIETAFKLERGSLMPKTAMNAHLVPKKKKRSRSVSHNRPHEPTMPIDNPRSSVPTKSLTLNANDLPNKERRFSSSYGSRTGNRRLGRHGRQRSKSNVSMQSGTISQALSMVIHDDDDDDDEEEFTSSEEEEEEENFNETTGAMTPRDDDSGRRGSSAFTRPKPKDKQRSASVIQPGSSRDRRSSAGRNQMHVGGVPSLFSSQSASRPMPSSKDQPGEYMQFLAQRAITNKMWNENDADRLCKSAVQNKEEYVTVHSMWVQTVEDLLLKYTRTAFKEEKRKSSKAGRRGSKSAFQIRAAFENIEDEKQITDSETKTCCLVGYPFGQTATAAKVAEAKIAVNDGAARIRLMVCGAKVVSEDWDYIMDEVKAVFEAVEDADVRVVLPETSQISDDLKSTFNAKMTEMVTTRDEKRAAEAKEQEAALAALEQKDPETVATTTSTSPAAEPSPSPTSSYDQESIDNHPNGRPDGVDGADPLNDVKSNGSLASVDVGKSPLSQSTTEVSATPIMAESEEPPAETPLMLSVSSETGDEIIKMGSPKSKPETSPLAVPEDQEVENVPAESVESPSKKEKKNGKGSPKKGDAKRSSKKGTGKKKSTKHKPTKSGDKGSKHKPSKSGDKGSKHKPTKSGDKGKKSGHKKKASTAGKKKSTGK